MSQYWTYCTDHGLDPIPPDSDTQSMYILMWVTDLAATGKAFSTVRNYAHAVRWLIARLRGEDAVAACDWDAVIRSARHTGPAISRARDAFDLDILEPYMDCSVAVLPFAVLFATLFILRPSEYLASVKPHHKPIQFDDVALMVDEDGTEFLSVTIRWSKTNATGEITTLYRRALPGNPMCIVAAYKRYVASVATAKRTGTFPKHPNGKDLDRATLTRFVKVITHAAGRPTDKISLHSLRKAGATRFWLASGDQILLMREGRWASISAMLRYIRADPTIGATFTEAVTDTATHASSHLLVAAS